MHLCASDEGSIDFIILGMIFNNNNLKNTVF